MPLNVLRHVAPSPDQRTLAGQIPSENAPRAPGGALLSRGNPRIVRDPAWWTGRGVSVRTHGVGRKPALHSGCVFDGRVGNRPQRPECTEAPSADVPRFRERIRPEIPRTSHPGVDAVSRPARIFRGLCACWSAVGSAPSISAARRGTGGRRLSAIRRRRTALLPGPPHAVTTQATATSTVPEHLIM